MVPWIFNNAQFNVLKIDKTCIEYVLENFGKDIILNLPLEMIDSGMYINNIYPYNIVLGLIDEINKFRNEYLEKLGIYQYMILVSNSIDEVLKHRSMLGLLRHVKPGFKRIIVLGLRNDFRSEDIELFIELARIYDYKPVFMISDKKIINRIESIMGLNTKSKCSTIWFNYNVFFYKLERNMPSKISIIYPYSGERIEFISFRDCMAFLCRRRNEPTLSSIIKFIIENAKPLLRIGDVVIDDETLLVASALGEYGSIRMTSKNLGLSYTRIRRIIKEIEKLENVLGVKLIESKRGGSEHGKTTYTHIGEVIINNLSELYGELARSYSNIIEKFLGTSKENIQNSLCIFPLTL